MLSETALNGSNPVDYIYFNGSRLARVVSGTPPYYYFADHLQSARVIVQAGQNTACYEADFEPYGLEHDAITATCTQNYKFTGKERDSESGLDYFGARYDSSRLGRFMSPDPLYLELRRLGDPQQLNLYTYARNNPVSLSDPTGLDVTLRCKRKKECREAVEEPNRRKNQQFKVELGNDNKLHVVAGSVAKNLSKSESALMGAINDTQNHATLNVSANTGQSEFGTHDSPGANSVDLGNLSKLDAASNAGGLNSGDALAHQAMDAYFSLSMGEEAADQAAAGLYPGLLAPTGNQNSLNRFGTAVVGSTFNQAISNGSGTERVTIQYITPIPAIDLFGKSAAARTDIARGAGSRVTGVTFVPPKQQ